MQSKHWTRDPHRCPPTGKRTWISVRLGVSVVFAVAASTFDALPTQAGSRPVVLNVLLDGPPSEDTMRDLKRYGVTGDVIPELGAVVLHSDASNIAALRKRPHVMAVAEDAAEAVERRPPRSRSDGPAGGQNTWNMDAVNVTELGQGRTVSHDGAGTYVAVLDSGLTPAWRTYFPQNSIATGLARDFTPDRIRKGGHGGPPSWEQDMFGHGTSVAAMVQGFKVDNPLYPAGAQGPKAGAAPGSTIIPVRVVDDTRDVTVSWLARGLVYVASLKARQLSRHAVVAQMAIIFYDDDPLLRRAVSFALAEGVILVASTGNSGTAGLHYPAAYPAVISVGATGATAEYQPGPDGNPFNWWREDDVPDPLDPQDFFVTDFSTRAAPGEDLDVVAPGVDVFAPTQWDGGYPDHRFVWGTSMASPHVAGIVALMGQKNPRLKPAQAEAAIEASAVALPAGCRDVLYWAYPPPVTFCWEDDATGSGLVDAEGALAATPSA